MLYTHLTVTLLFSCLFGLENSVCEWQLRKKIYSDLLWNSGFGCSEKLCILSAMVMCNTSSGDKPDTNTPTKQGSKTNVATTAFVLKAKMFFVSH